MPHEGWFLPGKDTYFAPFAAGTAPKRNGFQREHLLEAFKHVKDWRVAVDVGAHVGFWTLDMAERFDRVFAFEPANDTYDCLVKNMAGYANVTTAQFAIGDVNGRARIMEDPLPKRKGNTGARFVLPGEEAGIETVPMIALDGIDIPSCGLLKVDVEGFELQVLKGANRLIWKHKPVVIMECEKKFSRDRYGIPHRTAERFLLAHQYQCVTLMHPDKIFIPV